MMGPANKGMQQFGVRGRALSVQTERRSEHLRPDMWDYLLEVRAAHATELAGHAPCSWSLESGVLRTSHWNKYSHMWSMRIFQGSCPERGSS